MIRLGEIGVRVGGNIRSRHNCRYELDSEVDNDEVGDGEFGDNEVREKSQKMSKCKKLSKSKKTVKSNFFTSKAKLIFTKLR